MPAAVAPRQAPLEGLRVLNLCLVLAGPTCARLLAELGSDVIKIDGGRPAVTESFWIDTNQASGRS